MKLYYMLIGIISLLPLPVEAYQTKWASEKLMVIHEIKTQALEYGVDEKVAIRIANCESSLNPQAKNPYSSAKGIYQFTNGTWDYIGAKGHQFDYKENVKQFMKWYKKYPSWWQCF